MKSALPVLVAIVLLASLLAGQSNNSFAVTRTFHVSGTVHGHHGDDVVPGAKINFQNEQENRSIIADSKGSYEADLPLGLYTMTVQYQYLIGGRYPRVQEYVRPLFRVSLPTRIVLNASMFPERLNCDLGAVITLGHPETSEQSEQLQRRKKNSCGGEDLFAAPSSDGTPFQLYIRYPTRSPRGQVYDYAGEWLGYLTYTHVLVEYNLFTLTAEHVVYDSRSQTITATGNVMVANESAKTQHAASMTFNLRDGQPVPVR